MRAAASSIASGRPSRRAQIRAASGAVSQVRLNADHLPLLQGIPAKMFEGNERWTIGIAVGVGIVIVEECLRVAFHPLQLVTTTRTISDVTFYVQDILELCEPIQVS